MDKGLRAKLSLLNPWHFLALGFGSGLIPFMPGTFGTLAGFLLVALAYVSSSWTFLLLTVFACLIGIHICGKTAKDMGVHDHGSIVWDEIAGIMITFLFVPVVDVHPLIFGLGFLLFRFFDILKPWPIGFIDKHVSGGLGIMLDDIVAGAMACASLHAILMLNLL